jgi:hypothetical protein
MGRWRLLLSNDAGFTYIGDSFVLAIVLVFERAHPTTQPQGTMSSGIG